RWTRRDLVAATARVTTHLRRAGVAPGDRVAIAVRGNVQTVAALLGARAAGAIVCPIDPAQPQALTRLGPTVVIAESSIPGQRTIDFGSLLQEPGEPLAVLAGEGAWGISTSGSSGQPKTALLTQ